MGHNESGMEWFIAVFVRMLSLLRAKDHLADLIQTQERLIQYRDRVAMMPLLIHHVLGNRNQIVHV